MMDTEAPFWMSDWKGKPLATRLTTGQREMFPLTLDGILSDLANGNHLELVGQVAGDRYYCKRDNDGTPVRATEWFFTSLASHIGIPVPDFAPIANPKTGEILFGSKAQWGTANEFEVRTFLTTPQIVDKAISGENPWLAAHLARIYAFDILCSNPDRQLRNFLMVPHGGARRLVAFDFASARLNDLSHNNFAIAETQTLFVGRMLRGLHGFDLNAANETLERIAAIPDTVISGMLDEMPGDWLSAIEKEVLCGHWSSGAIEERVVALCGGLTNASLL